MSNFDIIFLSYDEGRAEHNWKKLTQRFPYAKRVHGVSGVATAHCAAAELAQTDFYFLVDGDNEIVSDFSFLAPTDQQNSNAVYVWRALNPVNDLVYGYGAVKLFHKNLFKQAKPGIDITTSVAREYKIVNHVASITHFNDSPREAWRGAFRECAKLASSVIKNQRDDQSLDRLNTWCTRGKERRFGEWCLKGAVMGREFGKKYANRPETLKLINDFSWLNLRFREVAHEFTDK